MGARAPERIVRGLEFMRDQSEPQENSTFGLGELPKSRASWRVAAAEARKGFVLAVRFLDGVDGTDDLSALVSSPLAGVFACLRDKSIIARAGVESGAVAWPNGIDLAPDAMYCAISNAGIFRPNPEITA
jgi:hypothetical protein